ncbi:hypothetical protein [Nonomuraea sp. NPDC050643]|uniref:hypothetical protein n=1 Tax=Nonomuraea sp. NPDC050643 TaxID=3155660 RepID=UPI0033E1476F
MPQRLALVRDLQRGPAQRFERGFARWKAVEGIIEAFIAQGMGAPGTWTSYVDAASLEALVRGVALAAGLSADDYGNPGARLWAGYLTDLKAGRLTVKAVHNAAWGAAEQISVDWGAAPANNPATPTLSELTVYGASSAYRLALRNEPALAPALRTLNQRPLAACYDWLTDTTNPRPVRDGSKFLITLTRTPADLPAVTRGLTRLAAFYPACAKGARPPQVRIDRTPPGSA